MVIDTPFLHCFFCGRRFPPDLDVRAGNFIRAWKVAVCLRCLEGNRDGLSVDHPAVRHLAQRGVILDLHKEGTVPWPQSECAIGQTSGLEAVEA